MEQKLRKSCEQRRKYRFISTTFACNRTPITNNTQTHAKVLLSSKSYIQPYYIMQ